MAGVSSHRLYVRARRTPYYPLVHANPYLQFCDQDLTIFRLGSPLNYYNIGMHALMHAASLKPGLPLQRSDMLEGRYARPVA